VLLMLQPTPADVPRARTLTRGSESRSADTITLIRTPVRTQTVSAPVNLTRMVAKSSGKKPNPPKKICKSVKFGLYFGQVRRIGSERSFLVSPCFLVSFRANCYHDSSRFFTARFGNLIYNGGPADNGDLLDAVFVYTRKPQR